MPAISVTRNSAAGRTGLILVAVTAGVIVAFTVAVAVADASFLAQVQAEVQSEANRVALAAAADLPKGAVAVLSTAGRTYGSAASGCTWRRYGKQEVQVGCWNSTGQQFSTGREKPNAVRITIRLQNELSPFARFWGRSEHEIEAQAVAVRQPLGNSLVADAGSTNAIR